MPARAVGHFPSGLTQPAGPEALGGPSSPIPMLPSAQLLNKLFLTAWL